MTQGELEMAGETLSRDLVALQTRVTQLSTLIRKVQGAAHGLQQGVRLKRTENITRIDGGIDATA